MNSRAEDPDADSGESSSPLLADLYPLEDDVFSLDATERFPEGIFRMPIPNALLKALSGLSGSALRAALALYRCAHRFDPETEWWVQADRGHTRAAIQQAAGLSGQGTRDGLAEIEARGWIEVDRTGQSYLYRWTMRALRPHEGGYTYVPTALLDALSADYATETAAETAAERSGDEAASMASTTELRVVLTVLRWTWGFTHRAQTSGGQSVRVHDRWKPLSTSGLARYAGCSKSAAKRAAQALQGRWIERVRPGHGTYQYRFLPEAVRFGPPENPSATAKTGRGETLFSGDAPNEIPPDRPSDPPPSIKNRPERANTSTQHSARPKRREREPRTARGAVRETPSRTKTARAPSRRRLSIELGTLSAKKRPWYEKLQNVGISPHRTAKILTRYSAARIEANFELYRKRAAKTPVRNPGGFLADAIEKGWALPPDPASESAKRAPGSPDLPDLTPKAKVSAETRDAYVKGGADPDHFHTCGFDANNHPRFMYLPQGVAPR